MQLNTTLKGRQRGMEKATNHTSSKRINSFSDIPRFSRWNWKLIKLSQTIRQGSKWRHKTCTLGRDWHLPCPRILEVLFREAWAGCWDLFSSYSPPAITFIMLGVSLTSRKQELPSSHQVFIGFLMPRFSGQDWIYLSTAMGFEGGINSEKSYCLRVTWEFHLFQDKNLLNLNVSVTGILIEKQDQATREGKKSHRTVINIHQVSGHAYNYKLWIFFNSCNKIKEAPIQLWWQISLCEWSPIKYSNSKLNQLSLSFLRNKEKLCIFSKFSKFMLLHSC